MVHLVSEAVTPHPQAAVIVVASEEGASRTPAAIDVRVAHMLRSSHAGMTQHFLTVPNSACANPMPAATFGKSKDGFTL